MNPSPSWIEGPTPQRGMGCFGKGCVTLVAFLIFLAIAFSAGTFFAVRYLRTSYFSTAPMQLPAPTATEEEQRAARANWYDFERAARAQTARRIEMTADQLNALIASEPQLRGKAFVTIDNDTLSFKLSVPLQDLRLFRGLYMNAECSVQSPPDGIPSHARFTTILVNGKAVGEDVLNWTGPWGFRHRIEQWTERDSIKTFQIGDGKVILESRGSE